MSQNKWKLYPCLCVLITRAVEKESGAPIGFSLTAGHLSWICAPHRCTDEVATSSADSSIHSRGVGISWTFGAVLAPTVVEVSKEFSRLYSASRQHCVLCSMDYTAIVQSSEHLPVNITLPVCQRLVLSILSTLSINWLMLQYISGSYRLVYIHLFEGCLQSVSSVQGEPKIWKMK